MFAVLCSPENASDLCDPRLNLRSLRNLPSLKGELHTFQAAFLGSFFLSFAGLYRQLAALLNPKHFGQQNVLSLVANLAVGSGMGNV